MAIQLGDYSFMFLNGELRIHKDTDLQRHRRYRLCTTLPMSDLFDIMWNIGIPVPNVNIPDRNTMINYLLGFRDNDVIMWNLDKIIWYYSWYISRTNRGDLCEIIGDYVQYEDDIKEPENS